MFPTSDGALGAYSFRTSLTKEYAVKLFDSCKEVTSFGLSAIGMICADMDCTYVVSELRIFVLSRSDVLSFVLKELFTHYISDKIFLL